MFGVCFSRLFSARACFLLCVLLSAHESFAYHPYKIHVDKAPSDYLQECEGIVYTYLTPKKLYIATRGMKKCNAMDVNGRVVRLNKNEAGFFYDLKMPAKTSRATVTFFSLSRGKKKRFQSVVHIKNPYAKHRAISMPRGEPVRSVAPVDPRNKQKDRLEALEICSKAYSFDRSKQECLSILEASLWQKQALINACSSYSSLQSHQLACLKNAQGFPYNPSKMIEACHTAFTLKSSSDACLNVAKNYQYPPYQELRQCQKSYQFISKQLACFEDLNAP